MKFYLASTLDNAYKAQYVSQYLKSKGWEETYDWTPHAFENNRHKEVLARISENEKTGVTGADVIFVFLPGKRGTHVEMGIALALGKPIVILADSREQLFKDGRLCSFYFHNNVMGHLLEEDIDTLAHVAHLFGRSLLRKPQTGKVDNEDVR